MTATSGPSSRKRTRKDSNNRIEQENTKPLGFDLPFILILTPLQKIILENMLCDTDNKSLLVEDHLHPILFFERICERLSLPVGERI